MHKLIHRAWSELLYGGHVVASDAAALVASMVLLTGTRIDWLLPATAYALAQVVYLNDRVRDAQRGTLSGPAVSWHDHQRTTHVKSRLAVWLCSVVALVAVSRSLGLAAVIGLQFLCGILYTSRLKAARLLGFKNLYTAAVWASAVLWLPVTTGDPTSNWQLMCIFAVVLLTVVHDTVASDYKDIASDQASRVMSLPATIGIERTHVVLSIVAVAAATALGLGVWQGALPVRGLAICAVFAYQLACTGRPGMLRRHRHCVLTWVMADCTFKLWLCALLAAGQLGL